MDEIKLVLVLIFIVLVYVVWIIAPPRHKIFLISLTKITNWDKVAWIAFNVWILLIIGLAVLTFVAYIPLSIVDVSKSSITCLDSTSYGLETLIVEYYGPKATMLRGKDAERATELCMKHQVFSKEIEARIQRARTWGWSEDKILEFATRDQLVTNKGPLYAVNFTTKTIGDWTKPILLSASVVLVGLAVLGLAMELPNLISRKIKEIFVR